MDTYNFFWIASEKYIKEARASAKSVEKHHPNSILTLFTHSSKAIPNGVFSEIVYFPPPKEKYWFLDSVIWTYNAIQNFRLGEKLVYLDTDTYVCAPLDGIFQALDRFDFVGTHAPGRITAPTVEPIPDSFPEYNIGVIGIKTSGYMEMFLDVWLLQYLSYQDIYRNNDQAPLREAIWNFGRKLHFGTLPIEYNFRFGMGGQVREEVKVLHGRSKDYERLEKIVNKGERKIRAWKVGELK